MRNTPLNEVLSENIREYREREKISQEEFAHRCGLHRTYIGAIERCERNVTLGTLTVIAKAIGCTAANLISKGGIKR